MHERVNASCGFCATGRVAEGVAPFYDMRGVPLDVAVQAVAAHNAVTGHNAGYMIIPGKITSAQEEALAARYFGEPSELA